MTSRSIVDEVTDELDDIAQRVLPRVFQHLDSKNGPLKIENVGSIVARSYRDEWAADREAALARAIRHAITYLSGSLGSVSAQEAMVRLFNLDGGTDFPDVEPLDISLVVGGKPYTYVRENFIETTGLKYMSPSKRKAKVAQVRRKLAEILTDPNFPNIPRPSEPQETSSSQDDLAPPRPVASILTRLRAHDNQPFVERETYAHNFQQLVDQDRHCIIFNGGRGNGKSRLALELVARQPEALETGIYLQANSAEMLSRELRAVFSARGVQESDLFEGFAALVSAADAPSYVILDNLEHPGLLDDLLPSDYRSVVVVTASQRIPAHANSSLEVEPMAEEEAIKLATELLPDLDVSEVEKVARALGGRPLAIVHTCGYILGSDLVTVEEFLQDLKADAASTLETAELAAEETLTAIYRRILRQLGELQADKNAPVCDLLELISCLAPDDIPSSLLRDSLSNAEGHIAPTTFNKAVLGLQSRFLITVSAGQFAIHPLTQEILRALLRWEAKEQARCLQLHHPIQHLIADETCSRFITDGTVNLLPHICKVALGLRDIEAMDFRQANVGHTLSVIWRGTCQVRSKREYLDVALEDMNEFILKVVRRFFEEDEPDLISLEDARPLLREFIPSVYEGGSIDSETYLGQMCQVLGVEDPEDLDQYSALTAQDLVEFCFAAHAAGQHIFVIAVLQLHEKRIWSERKDMILQGDCKKLEGSSLLALAEWDAAESSLKLAMGLYEQAGDELMAIRGRAHVIFLLGDLFLRSGQTQKEETNNERFEAFFDTMEDRLERDVLAMSYAHHFWARKKAADHLRHNYAWCQRMTYPLSELAARMSEAEVDAVTYQISEMASRSTEVLNIHEATREEYERGGYIRQSFDLTHDHILISGLVLVDRVDEVLDYYKQDGDLATDPLLRIRAEIARCKILLFHNVNKASERCFDSMTECGPLLEAFQETYWTAEFLAVYCVLLAHRSAPNADEAVAELAESYAGMGRTDRFEHLRRSIDALQEGDKLKFKREFSYMLTF